jgi:opacity protein-like surface antigen
MFTKWSGFVLLPVLLLIASSSAFSSYKLEKRSRLELKAGQWFATSEVTADVGVGGVVAHVEGDGLLGSLAYGRWLKENVAVVLSVGVLAFEAETRVGTISGVSTHTLTVAPIQLGVRYYVAQNSHESPWKPYVSAGLGPVRGHVSRVEVGIQVVTESRSETAFGGHLGGGLDIQLGRLIMLGASGSYFLMTDFQEALDDRKNFSGPEFGISLSFLFGRGVD